MIRQALFTLLIGIIGAFYCQWDKTVLPTVLPSAAENRLYNPTLNRVANFVKPLIIEARSSGAFSISLPVPVELVTPMTPCGTVLNEAEMRLWKIYVTQLGYRLSFSCDMGRVIPFDPTAFHSHRLTGRWPWQDSTDDTIPFQVRFDTERRTESELETNCDNDPELLVYYQLVTHCPTCIKLLSIGHYQGVYLRLHWSEHGNHQSLPVPSFESARCNMTLSWSQ